MEAALGFRLDFWDYVTFAAISVMVFAGLGLAVFILGLPGRIAIARNHPEADAVNLMGWVGLGDAQELLLHVRTSGRDAVVPFWMEGIALYVECRDLLVGDLDALGIGVGIEFAADFETGFRRGVCDQFDGHEEADERHGAPVLGNVAEHAVLDLVPLRGPRRIMADLDDQAGLVGELLQRHLP